MNPTITKGLSLALLAAPAFGQTFTEITEGTAEDVSSNGIHVAGRSSSGGAYIWNILSGATNAGEDDAVGVSDDGTRLYGNMDEPFGGLGTAGVWDVFAGTWTAMNTQSDENCSGTHSSAYGWSNDGSVATGLAWEGCKGRAFAWTPGVGFQNLPMMDSSFDARARGNGVSGDGTVIGGWDRIGGTDNAALWTSDGAGGWNAPVHILAGHPIGGPNGQGGVVGLSTDGTYACGSGISTAFVYSAADGITVIEKLNPLLISEATAVSDDGNTVVGYEYDPFPFGSTPTPWIWRKGHGIENLNDVVAAYGLVPTVELWRTMDCSADGRTLVGHATTPGGFFQNRGFFIQLPEAPFQHLGGASVGENGEPNLTGTGTLVAGSASSLSLENGASSAFGGLAVSVASTPIPIFGGTLHTFPVDLVLPVTTDVNGDWGANFTWLPAAASGQSLYFQVGLLDGTTADGIALSNGLQGTTD